MAGGLTSVRERSESRIVAAINPANHYSDGNDRSEQHACYQHREDD
jgi:hypothetical protein